MADDIIQHATLKQQNHLNKQSNSRLKFRKSSENFDEKHQNKSIIEHNTSVDEIKGNKIKAESPRILNQPSIDDLEKAID